MGAGERENGAGDTILVDLEPLTQSAVAPTCATRYQVVRVASWTLGPSEALG